MYFREYHSYHLGYQEGEVFGRYHRVANLESVTFGCGNWGTITGIAWDSGSQFHDLLGCGAHLQ